MNDRGLKVMAIPKDIMLSQMKYNKMLSYEDKVL